MITSRSEYLSKLAEIQVAKDLDYYQPIPETEKIYQVNLNERTIEAPKHLSVTNDHEAEIIFFEVDRYYDLQDLMQTTCLITYVNAAGEPFIYNVPRLDGMTKRDEGKIIIPWVVGQDAVIKAGIVRFSLQFYIIDPISLKFTYKLNTEPAQTRVLQGLEPSYTEANEAAAADYKAGSWGTKYKDYFVKDAKSRFIHASSTYDANTTYYLRTEEARIPDGMRLEAIYQKLQELNRSALKWVDI